MKKRATFSPVLLELIVVILFFALSMSVVIRLIAASDETSRDSAALSRAVIAMESVIEEIKAEPPGAADFDAEGESRFTRQAEGGILLTVLVRREQGTAGFLYNIEVTAYSGEKPLGSLTAARYVRGGPGA